MNRRSFFRGFTAVLASFSGMAYAEETKGKNKPPELPPSTHSNVSNAINELKTDLNSSSGFKNIGQVESYAALKHLVPTHTGQSILLKSYFNGWASQGKAPCGGGQFVAVNGPAVEDDGSIAVVNNSWHWRRIVEGPYTPEMFGANGSGADDVPAIRKAVDAAILSGKDEVRGDGIYTFKTSYVIPPAVHQRHIPGANVRQGLGLYLNVVIVDAESWRSVPRRWWDAQAAFYCAVGVEHLRLHVNEFDGGGKATFFHTKGGGLATSLLHIGNMRNHIIGVRNFHDMAVQSGMNNITGHLWQDGYIGVLNGGTGHGGGVAECMGVDVNWMATHKYMAISMQDRSHYAHIKAGTFDYNGDNSAMITLSNVVMKSIYAVQFGDTLTDGRASGTALSNVMSNYGTQVLFITESANKRDGISDYRVGRTLTNEDGTFSATIADITLTSEKVVRYFDVILSNITGGFSRCNVTGTYVGGVYGSNMFTNQIWAPNAVAGTNTSSYMGLQIGGSASNQYLYQRELFKEQWLFAMSTAGLEIGVPVALANNPLYGYKGAYLALIGKPVEVMIFPPAVDPLLPHVFEVHIASSIAGISSWAIVRVGTDAISVTMEHSANLALSVSGLALIATASGSNSTLSIAVTRKM